MGKDPLRSLSRGIADAVEHDPAFVAMTEGNGVIPTSWGNLASRLVETGIVEPTPKAVCEFLSIEPADLRDPSMVITNHDDVQLLEDMLHRNYETKYRKEHGPAANADMERLEAVKDRWKVDDGEATSERLQAEIDQETSDIRQLAADTTEFTARQTAINLKCLERDAYRSGFVVRLDDFVSTMLGIEDLSYFDQANLISAAKGMINGLTYSRRLDTNIPIANITIGNDEITDFLRSVGYRFRSNMNREIEKRWKAVVGLLIAGFIRDHPILAGNEK